MDRITIGSSMVKDQRMTTIRIGEASGELPKHLMLGKKECGYIVRDDTTTPWYWDNIFDRDGHRYISFPWIDILPFDEITRSLRTDALAVLRSLARALTTVPAGFVHPTNGFIETWRIYVIREGGFLLLPDSLSQLMLYSVSDEDRFEHFGRYVKPEVEPPFGLCHQFTQFLYLAAAGFAPYEDSAVREDRYQHIPLSLGFTGLDGPLASWIDSTLSMHPKDQRLAVSAAYSGEENLSWWLRETEGFTWQATGGTWTIDRLVDFSGEVASFRQAQIRRADRRVFWRKKGALVVSITIVVVIVAAILGSIIARELQPPYTKGMEPQQVVAEFFVAQNELDVQKMSDSLARGVKNPFELEVSGLFVNSRVRQAYEGFESVVRADQWIAEGMPAVPGTSIIYGVTDLTIERINANEYRAAYRYYGPAETDSADDPAYAGAGDQKDTGIKVTEMLRVTDFTLTDEKGYWQITAIVPVKTTEIRTFTVETYELPQAVPMGDIPAGEDQPK